MNVFDTHRRIIDDYASYIRSFIHISDPEIARTVETSLGEGRLWPQPLLQFNPAYEQAGGVEESIASGLLHEDLRHTFGGYSLYRHQRDAIALGVSGTDFVVTSGTGSGKSLTYIATVFHHLLTHRGAVQGAGGVTAVVVYPMNALINSQTRELETYREAYRRHTGRAFPVTFGQYTGQEREDARERMREEPPQILLTNYMMLELLLTRVQERPIRDAIFEGLRYLVFDELHTYRGRQGADIAMLIRRILAECRQPVCCIGTSATMVSVGSAESQRGEVARVASTVFGRPFEPEQIVDETLARSLDDAGTEPSRQALHAAIVAGVDAGASEAALRGHPLAVWLERRVALDERDGRLVRRTPMGFHDVVRQLADDSGAPEADCRQALEATLQWVSAVNQRIRESGSRYTLLPFKLHQFIAQTGSVYTTLDQGEDRFITLEPGIYKHDEDRKPIFPNVFSRVTGHPFLCVSLAGDRLTPREFRASGTEDEDEGENATDGYLIVGDEVWDPDRDLDYLPDAWVRTARTSGRREPHPSKRDRFPRALRFDEHGRCSETEPLRYRGWFMRAPLLFDPTGGVFYDPKTSDGTKLTRLGNEGRSTSTTITAFSILDRLRDGGHPARDQKLLSFTDSRQDAALQAGHFNDFVQVVRLRAGIRQALERAPGGVLDYATLGKAVFDALSLPFRDYGNRDTEPELAPVRRKYDAAFQDYLLFRALADLRRSWRIVLPNLEACALLAIDYLDLDEIAAEDGFWADVEIANVLPHPDRRGFLADILDYFRLEYAIHSENYLRPERLKEFEKRFREQLKAPWTLDADEDLAPPSVVRLDRLHQRARLSSKSMGPTSALGKYLKHVARQSEVDPDALRAERYRAFVLGLMRKLKEADYLVEESARSASDEEVPVFRLRIEKVRWTLGDGETVRPDPIKRIAYKDGASPPPNAFFRALYRRDFAESKRLEAADHTGQLGVQVRRDREERFRAEWTLDEAGTVPDEARIRSESISALFCSPTMELGVDIGGLGVVHMRNAPPNAANYVQRSGRAGRSGQGALVFTYCSGFSAHDRHYFQHQADLVAGAVQAPRIDLRNRELLLSHLHALAVGRIGLPGAETGRGERPSLMRLVEDGDPAMPLARAVVAGLALAPATLRAIETTFRRAIADFAPTLRRDADAWYRDDWIERSLRNLGDSLDGAMQRWRKMYQSARTLLTRATQEIDSGLLKVNSRDYKSYARQQAQAIRQLNLLRNEQGGLFDLNEFYPYRYLASEGFLPGYNFTRLPVRIFVPIGSAAGEYISRPRAIALREFGPRNLVYHNGRKYRVSQLFVQDAEAALTEAKLSRRAGYFLTGEQRELEICPFSGLDLSDNANTEHLYDLLEMAESRGEETARITCEEEERVSRGYQVESYFQVDGGDFASIRSATVRSGESRLLNLRFIPAARLVSVSRGWRSQRTEGFPIGMSSGRWGSKMPEPDPDAREETRLVKLWTSNVADALYIEPVAALGLDPDGVVTLQHALKRAIESVFQVEPAEIGVSTMGDPAHPNILIHEATEGSLGVLSQIVEDVEVLRRIVESAERLCRFDDETYKAPASYDDLMSYYNQRDHARLDRFLIQGALARLGQATVEVRTSAAFQDYEAQYRHMLRHLDPHSRTERTFIDYLYRNGLRLPDAAQKRVPGLYCQPDFYYEPRIWVFCDGTPHDAAMVRDRDESQRQRILARGDEVWSWHYSEDLGEKIARRPDIFSRVR